MAYVLEKVSELFDDFDKIDAVFDAVRCSCLFSCHLLSLSDDGLFNKLEDIDLKNIDALWWAFEIIALSFEFLSDQSESFIPQDGSMDLIHHFFSSPNLILL